MSSPVYLVRGSDEILLGDALSALIGDLVGDGDRTLLVDEIDPPDDATINAIVEAAQTPPFLTDSRIVFARHVERYSRADDVAPLVAYLGDPLPTTTLVLEWSGGRVPKSLTDAIKNAGGEDRDTAPGRKVDSWLDERIAESALSFTASARRQVADWVGEDVGRVPGLLHTLESAYGPGAKLTDEDVEPFLGSDAGGVQPWDLTDAIDKGDIAGAIGAVSRMMRGGGRHPLAIMATLTTHVTRMLALDGADVRNEKEAAELLGMTGSTFPAKKALNQSRKLGHDNMVAAVELVATADLDLRGQRDLPNDAVMEVLVARLARLAR